MPRPPRVDHPAAWHHVINRGSAGSDVFHNDQDRQLFVELLAEAAAKSGLEVHAYCLMSNHYHLLLRSLDGRLTEGMRHLSSRFTQTMNYRRGRDGPLFRGRFASIGIANDAHLVQASRYIHLNPVTAGLAQRPEDWPWSSASAYVGNVSGPEWLKTEFVLSLLDAPRSARTEYRQFLDEGVDIATQQFYIDARMSEGRKWGSDPIERPRRTQRGSHGV